MNCLSEESRRPALADLWTRAFDTSPPEGFLAGKIFIGKKYGEQEEETEVDSSIEGDGILVFVEAIVFLDESGRSGEL